MLLTIEEHGKKTVVNSIFNCKLCDNLQSKFQLLLISIFSYHLSCVNLHSSMKQLIQSLLFLCNNAKFLLEAILQQIAINGNELSKQHFSERKFIFR